MTSPQQAAVYARTLLISIEYFKTTAL